MQKIHRKAVHELSIEELSYYTKKIEKNLDKRKSRITIKRENLVYLTEGVWEQIRLYTLFPMSEITDQVGTLRLFEASLMQASYHRLANNPEMSWPITLPEHPEVSWKGEGILKTGFICPSMWLDAYFTSVIVRDKPSIDLLANFPISLMKQSSTKAGELSYMLVDVIQSFHNRTSDYPLTTDIGYDFEEVLIKNLQFQEQYQMRLDEPDDLISIETFISFPLLGMACMWYDKGNRLSVETGWLPPYLVEGRWLDDVKAGRITR
ncbi:immunity 49 family protein [Vibrio rotiferianus]|uniref:immunity 49 family protein n=1 Tax=Vibrio rotiferianus TaxID=190895 RepID=UPI00390A70A0